jgi:hypothetical protein
METDYADASDHQRGYTDAFRDVTTLWSTLRLEYGDDKEGMIDHFDSFVLAATAKMSGLGDDIAKSFLKER